MKTEDKYIENRVYAEVSELLQIRLPTASDFDIHKIANAAATVVSEMIDELETDEEGEEP